MAEYICREAIIDDLEKEIEAGNVALDEDVWINKGLRIAIRDIKDSKSADVQPVKRGFWRKTNDIFYRYCSVCGTKTDIAYSNIAKYCAECGAKMDLPETTKG